MKATSTYTELFRPAASGPKPSLPLSRLMELVNVNANRQRHSIFLAARVRGCRFRDTVEFLRSNTPTQPWRRSHCFVSAILRNRGDRLLYAVFRADLSSAQTGDRYESHKDHCVADYFLLPVSWLFSTVHLVLGHPEQTTRNNFIGRGMLSIEVEVMPYRSRGVS